MFTSDLYEINQAQGHHFIMVIIYNLTKILKTVFNRNKLQFKKAKSPEQKIQITAGSRLLMGNSDARQIHVKIPFSTEYRLELHWHPATCMDNYKLIYSLN